MRRNGIGSVNDDTFRRRGIFTAQGSQLILHRPCNSLVPRVHRILLLGRSSKTRQTGV